MSDNSRGHKISAVKAKEAVDDLDKLPPAELSVTKFVREYWDAMEKTGRSTKYLYDYFVGKGIPLGKYDSFYRIYNTVSNAKKRESMYEVIQDVTQEQEGKE